MDTQIFKDLVEDIQAVFLLKGWTWHQEDHVPSLEQVEDMLTELCLDISADDEGLTIESGRILVMPERDMESRAIKAYRVYVHVGDC